MARPRIRLLIPNDPHPMRIERDLAKEIGLNESIVLLQLEYLITISNNERDGRLWTYQSLQDLHETYFPWWSPATISRIVKSLEQMQLIVIGNFNKLGYDRTQWYALNEDGIAKLTSVLMHSDAIFQNAKWISQNETSILQNDLIDHSKMQNGSSQNETTIPESTQRVPKEREQPAPTSPAIELYTKLTGAKPAKFGAEKIAAEVSDLTRWRDTVKDWLASGYKATNIKGMLDWYHGKGRHQNNNAPANRQPADLPTITAATDSKRVTSPEERRRIMEETRAKVQAGK